MPHTMVVYKWACCPDAFVTFTCNFEMAWNQENVATRTTILRSTEFSNPNVQNQAEKIDQWHS